MIGSVSMSMLVGVQPVSSISHLFAATAALVAAIPLVRLGGQCPGRRRALTIYASCVIATLAISGVYHALGVGAARLVMQRVDHAAIWCLIAGSFTGVHGVMWKGFWGRGLLTFVWSYAFIGIVLQILWFGAFGGTLGLVLYLLLGWFGVVSICKLGRQIGWAAVLPVFYAGLSYSGGAILEAFKWPVLIPSWVGAHEIFHFAVIAGVILHWRFIRKLLIHHAPLLPVGAPMPLLLAPAAARPV